MIYVRCRQIGSVGTRVEAGPALLGSYVQSRLGRTETAVGSSRHRHNVRSTGHCSLNQWEEMACFLILPHITHSTMAGRALAEPHARGEERGPSRREASVRFSWQRPDADARTRRQLPCGFVVRLFVFVNTPLVENLL